MRRTAYPRPELRRAQWTNLCGRWEFDFDFGKSAKESGALFGKYKHRIEVPFCPESKLSGLEYKDFIPACMYRRKFSIKKNDGMRTLLNFEAVYFHTEVYINEKQVGSHDGGYTPFSFDITDAVTDGENTVVVWCCGDPRNGREPSGKQCLNYYSKNCNYTRSTGIYQPVWLETVPDRYLKSVKLDTYEDGSVYARLSLSGEGAAEVTLTATLDGKRAASFKGTATKNDYIAVLNVKEPKLWSPESPTLYDLKIEIRRGDAVDRVQSYFGIRTVSLDKYGMRINGKRVFQRLVLDQGYYPESVYTAPSDDAFAEDIRLSMRMGFNGARLHERVFERRFLYEADKTGYLVWGEYPNWGFNVSAPDAFDYYGEQWFEAVERDYNHPALIGWCPFNETWNYYGVKQNDKFVREIYLLTKMYDKTRPVIDTSGNYHTETDIYDVHDYNQKPETFEERYASFENGVFNNYVERQTYGGQPYMISEYGGIYWGDGKVGWGYGNSPKSEEEYVERFCGLTKAMLKNPRVCGFCYTQLYDIEQEQNGIYRYDRSPKFDDKKMDIMAAAVSAPAAFEEQKD